jgi:aspartyl-tRNA(Asn)/glutamyl-tRNA(Gln) amidotransferase subunit A
MARSVAQCALADAVLAADSGVQLIAAELRALRVGVVQGVVLEDLDPSVARAFEHGLKRLQAARCSDVSLSALTLMDAVTQRGGIAPKEAYDGHRALLSSQADAIDPFVRTRMLGGATLSEVSYQENLRERAQAIVHFERVFEDYDVLVLPTTPITAPTLAEVASPEGFAANNRLLLRNTSIANFFDLCAISLPAPDPGPLPCGIMLFGRSGADHALLRAALALEAAFAAIT